jgi:hypothetical protein
VGCDGGAPAGVDGERDGNEGDAEELERVAHPPAPAAGLQQQRRVQRHTEPDGADDDDQIGRPPCQREGARGALGDDQEEDEPDGTHRVGGGVAGLWKRRDRAGPEQHDDAGDGERRQRSGKRVPDRGHVLRAPHGGQRSERQDRGADR